MSYITESTPCGVKGKGTSCISNLHLQCMFLWFGQSSLAEFWRDHMLAYSDSVKKNGKNQLIMSSNSEPTAKILNDIQNHFENRKDNVYSGQFCNFQI